MIVRRREDTLVLAAQLDHAALSGLFARLIALFGHPLQGVLGLSQFELHLIECLSFFQ